jgi:DNA repair protein RecO (recombination protein O)
MAHHVYTTEAFVIESIPSGEANKMFTVFTRELGMIRASAQGVRHLKSKLRFSLQDYSYAQVSAVRGKEIWRITNAKAEWNLYQLYKTRTDIMHVIAQVFALLKRLMPGEEKNEHLFMVLHHAFQFLKETEIKAEEVKSFERIIVMNILHHLGYMGQEQGLTQFIDAPWSHELLTEMNEKKAESLSAINRAIKETQL